MNTVQDLLNELIREYLRIKVIAPAIADLARRQPPPWMALRGRWAQKDGRPADSKMSRRK